MNNGDLSKDISNSARKRKAVEKFNKEYAYKQSPEYQAKLIARRRKLSSRGIENLIAMMNVGY